MDAIDHYLLSFVEALEDSCYLRCQLAKAHATLPGDILIIDYVHIAALLIGEDRGTRHGNDGLRLHGFKKDGNELIGNELAKLDTSRRGGL